jgi:hypothetical protein
MKVKIQPEKSKEWGSIRQGIFWAAFCILLALAAFETGWILRDFQKDDHDSRITKLEQRTIDHSGRIVTLEGPSGARK